MASGIYIAMQGARVQEHRLDTLNHDLANANTPGFKRQAAIYRQIHNDATKLGDPDQAMGLHHPVRYLPEDRLPVHLEQRYTQFEQGALRFTGNDLDIAIDGPGFFTLAGPDGPRYTRNGSFTLARDGALVTHEGHPVLDATGQPIRLPTADGRLRVATTGEIFIDDQPAGRLGLADFGDLQALARVGDSTWQNPNAATNPATPVTDPRVHQAHIESANVNPIRTMVELIKTNRVFEMNTRAIQAYKAMDDQANRDVGRLS
ncbi:MAG: flagellar basal-body rod protein FlgF [bacterium]